MKTLSMLLLSAALFAQPIVSQAQTNSTPRPQGWECLLLVGIAMAGGAYIVISCYHNNAGMCDAWHKLILEQDNYDGMWIPIATNIVFVRTNKTEVFRSLMKDDAHRYRVIDAGKYVNILGQLVPQFTE